MFLFCRVCIDSAEWNFYNHAGSVASVLRSKIPISMIPLDATNDVPDNNYLSEIQDLPLLLEAWTLSAQAGDGYFWDPLTSAAITVPSVITSWTSQRLLVHTSGPSEGRIYVDVGESDNACVVDVATGADLQKMKNVLRCTFSP